MLRKLRIALVVSIMAVAVASSADSASALGFYRGGDFGFSASVGPEDVSAIDKANPDLHALRPPRKLPFSVAAAQV